MASRKTGAKLVTEEEKRLAIGASNRKLLARLGLDPALYDAKNRFGSGSNLSPEQQQRVAMVMGIQVVTDQLLPTIRTQEDLDDAVRKIEGWTEHAPKQTREVMKQIRGIIRRDGGPGRKTKLNAEEVAKFCDLVNGYIRKKNGITQAIEKAVADCPRVFGKTIAKRTGEDYWSRRDEFPSE